MNPGDTFEGFRIVRRLAPGSMGAVYLASRLSDGQEVALKVVQGGPHDEDRERIDFELRGAQIQKDLSSLDEHVVPVYQIFHSGADLAIAMRFIDGPDLFTALKNGPFAPERAARHALALCNMLMRVSQDTPLVHGDLKPRNILLTRQDEIRVIDFGIAKLLAESRPNTFNPYRSAPYSPPERLGTSHVDSTSDLWAIGVILYEMIAAHHPYPVPNEDLRVRILQGPPDPLPPGCPEMLRNLILRALSARPELRYPSASALAADLRRCLEGHSVPPPLPGNSNDTVRGGADPNATVRSNTSEPLASTNSGRLEAIPVIPAKPGNFRWVKASGIALAALLAAGSASRQYSAWNDASALASQLEARQISASAAWESYTAIENRCKLPGVCRGLRLAMRRKLLDEADETIADFRSDRPAGRLAQWQAAERSIQRAIQLGSSGNDAQGRLSLCDAHICRIRALSTDRQRLLNKSEAEFQDAMRKLPKDSFDAQLGLIPLYIYDLGEYDKGLQMIDEAGRRGHPEGRRERAEKADALRQRGEKMQDTATERETRADQARGYLFKAREDLETALGYYQQAGDFTYSIKTFKKECSDHIKQIDALLSGLSGQ